MTQKILIIGASHAGIQLAASLRERSVADEIVIVGGEPFPPYQRPPLSKSFHSESAFPAALQLRLPAFFSAQRIALRVGDPIVAVDHDSRQARTDAGHVVGYSKLALAVGARARRLGVPGADFDGVMYLRTYADALNIGRRMPRAGNVVIIGAGLIGMEFAALAVKQGKSVTVVEVAANIMQRVASTAISQFMHDAHVASGIRVLLGRSVSEIVGTSGAVRGVMLDDGTELAADVVIAGIGSEPRTELAEAIGLECANGILVDDHARTSVNDIVAVGDCTSQRHPQREGEVRRFESVSNAVRQAMIAAATINDGLRPRTGTPWFWSDQGTLRLQTAGLLDRADKQTIETSADGNRLIVRHYRDGQPVAIECVNCPGEFLAARRQLDRGASPHATDMTAAAG